MDFIAVLEFLLGLFEKEKVDFAFIGGVALQMAGVERATGDVDFLILTEDVVKIKPGMIARGYKVVADTEDSLCFQGDKAAWGRVDFLLAHRRHAKDMLKRAQVREGLMGKYRYKVATPEDVIGLKVQAMANSPHRWEKDRPDIKALLNLHGDKLDMGRVREYFKIFEMEPELEKILEEVKNESDS
jgi:hypothetical protein